LREIPYSDELQQLAARIGAMTENEIAAQIVDAAYRVHVALGPGLLESVYLAVLAYELSKRGLAVETERDLPVIYENVRIAVGFRIDMIIEEKVIVELKSVEKLATVHQKQLLTYLRLGLLINFGEARIKDGIQRVVNQLP
jgi:GxxExxY protein